MIDQRILLSRLHNSFGIIGPVLNFIKSYLTGRSQCVRAEHAFSRHTSCNLGDSQGFVLGPIFLSLYTRHPSAAYIASNFNISLQQYADDSHRRNHQHGDRSPQLLTLWDQLCIGPQFLGPTDIPKMLLNAS